MVLLARRRRWLHVRGGIRANGFDPGADKPLVSVLINPIYFEHRKRRTSLLGESDTPMETGQQSDLPGMGPREIDEGVFDAQLSFPTPFVEAPQPLTTIIKRNGQEVPFERAKIAASILKAAQSIGGEDADRANSLASGVTIYLSKKLKGVPPTVDQVQDAVEKVLIEMGHARTALTFARHRDKRARIRRLRQGDMRTLLTELAEARRVEGLDAPERGTGSLFVRTSDEQLAGWDRTRIVDALIRETRMERSLAEVIALEVEGQILAANVKTLTAPLVRELVDAKLAEHGLEEYRRRHMRLGVPLYDAERILSAPNQGEHEGIQDPAATDIALAQRVKREYALTQVFSQEVADAHIEGALHLHHLGLVDRLHSCRPSLEYVKTFGVRFPGVSGTPRVPSRPETLVAQVGQFTSALHNHVARTVGWPALNVYLAPFVAGMSADALRPIAQMLLFGFSPAALRRDGDVGHTDIELRWSMPDRLKDLPTIGPGGVHSGASYGALEHAAQQVAWAILEAQKQICIDEGRSPGVTVSVPVSDVFFSAPGRNEWLRHTAECIAAGVRVQYVLERDSRMEREGARPWEFYEVALHDVSINLPRAAYTIAQKPSAQPIDAFFAQLDRVVDLAAQAHAEKQAFIERLLTFRDLGPLSLLATQHEGRPLLDLNRAVSRVGVVGLNECVQYLTGRPLHESPEAMELAGRITAHLADRCRVAGEDHGLCLQPAQTNDEATAQRFALHDLRTFQNAASAVVKTDSMTHDITYTPGTCLAKDSAVAPAEQARLEGRFHEHVTANAITWVDLRDTDLCPEAIAHFVQKAFYRSRAKRIAFVR